ncbi:hypothetical protein ABI069_14645, partial [Enterococcus faecium]|uniref:hypothetical protein n=1 Tax=Enterococcus faecium TaxID=1352 RepID=UPI003F432B15
MTRARHAFVPPGKRRMELPRRPRIRTSMLDVQTAPAQPSVIHRGDYRRPAWLVPDIHLDFDLDPAATIVRARL